MVQLGQLVTDALEVDEVESGDPFDLPTHPMALPVTPLVPGGAVEQQMIRVDVDLDTPLGCGNR